MSIAQTAARQIQRLVSREGKTALVDAATPKARQAARELFDDGGKMAQDVLGLGVTGAHPRGVKAVAKKAAVPIERRAIENHKAGHRRERWIEKFLKAIFPKEENYRVFREQYLRDRKGRIAIDETTHQSRRIDFVVLQGKDVVRSIEVTSRTVDKAAQLRKEANIRKAGGRYLLDPDSGALIRIPAALKTKVVRLA